MPFIPFKGFAPDGDLYDPGNLEEASNVVTTTRSSLVGFPNPNNGTDIGETLASNVQYVINPEENSGKKHILFGNGWGLKTTAEVFEICIVSGVRKNRARHGSSFSKTARAVMTTAQYGDDLFLAQKGEIIQHLDLTSVGSSLSGSSTSTTSCSGSFSALPTAPKALQVVVALDFVMGFNVNDTGGHNGSYNNPDGWACSAAGDVDSWVADIATQANFGRITHAPGPITAARRLGNDVIVWKRNSMFIGRYVGGGLTWDFRQVPGDALGTWTPGHVASIENAVMWFGSGGFWMFDGSSRPSLIGDQKVVNYVRRTAVEREAFFTTFHDPTNKDVYWLYAGIGKIYPTAYVSYNYVSGTWGAGTQNISAGVESLSNDAVGSEGYFFIGEHDDTNVLGNLSKWRFSDVAGNRRVADSAFRIRTARIGMDGKMTHVTRVRPRFKRKHVGTLTMTHLATNDDSTAVTITSGVTFTRGSFDHAHEARWHQFEIVGGTGTNSAWELDGLDIEIEKGSDE